MKSLTLVRHAKSSWEDPELNDFERPLNKRGRRDLPSMAARLKDSGAIPDLILSSASVRTTLTTQGIIAQQPLLEEKFHFPPELYLASCETLLYTLQNCDDSHQHIMLVGHNPGLETLLSYLTQLEFDKFPTCATAQLTLCISSWHELAAGCATLTELDYPKLHLSTAH